MKFINFTIIRFSICLSLGIFTAYTFEITSISFFKILIGCFVLLGICWVIIRKQLFQTIYFGILTYACFFFLGGFLVQNQLPEFKEEHYLHILDESSKSEKDLHLSEMKIIEVLKPDLYYSKYIVAIKVLDGVKTDGKILLNISKKKLTTLFTIDDQLLIYSSINEIQKPLNPHQFDYAKYMKLLGVYYQIKIIDENNIIQKKGTSTLKGISEQFRSHIIKKLKIHDFQPNELSIIQALLLGQKRDIDKKLYKDYTAAGAIHILAVSGLHVGIIFLIISYLLSFLDLLPKGKIFKSLFIIIILWGFALIAGMSPSVVRAVTMFSFFALAQSLDRPTNSYNTLFLSYFFLLLIKPLWLFHVGFQMSYIAVFFILWVQPKLYKYYLPKFYIDKLIWSILTVTFSAQVGILPLSIFYFHQFPGLSFLTNIVILPFLGIILGGGIIIILLALCNLLPSFITTAYNNIIELLNNFISWVAEKDTFIIQDIFFSEGKLLTTYLFIFCIILYWKKTTPQKLTLLGVSIFLVLSSHIWDLKNTSQNQFIIFNKNRKTLIGIKEAQTLKVFTKDTLKNYKKDYPIKEYRISENIIHYSQNKLPNLWKFNHEKVLVIDSLGVYSNAQTIDVILLIESPKINLNRLIDSLQPKQIIVNGSNYPYLKKQWEKTCRKKKIPFFDISKKGAFVIE